jgi:hypothetical protein
MPAKSPAEERFWPKVERRGDDECWPWLAHRNREGYGKFNFNGEMGLAHRFAYELLVGPIPSGLVLDHVCHNRDSGCTAGDMCPHRACVNPAHLEPVTPAENLRRSGAAEATRQRHAAKTHCPQGHPYAGDNLLITPRNSRKCRTCERERLRRRRILDLSKEGANRG